VSAEAWQHGLASGGGDAAKAARQQYRNDLGFAVFLKKKP